LTLAVAKKPGRGTPTPAAPTLAALALATLAVCLAGCQGPKPPPKDEFFLQPLPVQQLQAYPETVTGRFVSLADFEDSPLLGQLAQQQVEAFSIESAGLGSTGVPPVPSDPTGGTPVLPTQSGGQVAYTLKTSRTGVGAMTVVLPPGASLVYKPGALHNFSDYRLLQVALRSEDIRDDLTVELVSEKGRWRSGPVLLRPGWNNVQIDLQRLGERDFDPKAVGQVRLSFASADKPVSLVLDDLMLIDNQRKITPTPPGMEIIKSGLDYEIRYAGTNQGPQAPPIRLAQGGDGLWRLGDQQPLLALSATQAAGGLVTESPASVPAASAEDISLMGSRRLGEVTVLEANALRVRLANCWYFPDASGAWASLAVRQVRWEYTFYGDGRWVTDLVLNNAGGKSISTVLLAPPGAAAWSDGRSGPAAAEEFRGSVGHWSFSRTVNDKLRTIVEANYAKPPPLTLKMGRSDPAGGDSDGDGFDESQGCYCVRAMAGHCRFTLACPVGPIDVYVRIRGQWTGPASASCQGLALRDSVGLDDKCLLVRVPAVDSRPVTVEVTGPVSPLDR
jgi:hypothetical protein